MLEVDQVTINGGEFVGSFTEIDALKQLEVINDAEVKVSDQAGLILAELNGNNFSVGNRLQISSMDVNEGMLLLDGIAGVDPTSSFPALSTSGSGQVIVRDELLVMTQILQPAKFENADTEFQAVSAGSDLSTADLTAGVGPQIASVELTTDLSILLDAYNSLPPLDLAGNSLQLEVSTTQFRSNDPALDDADSLALVDEVLEISVAELRAAPAPVIVEGGNIVLVDSASELSRAPIGYDNFEEIAGIRITSESWGLPVQTLTGLPEITLDNDAELNVIDTGENIANADFSTDVNLLKVSSTFMTGGNVETDIATIASIPNLVRFGGTISVTDTGEAIADAGSFNAPPLNAITSLTMDGGVLNGTVDKIKNLPDLLKTGDSSITVSDSGDNINLVSFGSGPLAQVDQIFVTADTLSDSLDALLAAVPITANGGSLVGEGNQAQLLSADFNGDDNLSNLSGLLLTSGVLSADADTLLAMPDIELLEGGNGKVQLSDDAEVIEQVIPYADAKFDVVGLVEVSSGQLTGTVAEIAAYPGLSRAEGASVIVADDGGVIMQSDFDVESLAATNQLIVNAGILEGSVAYLESLPSLSATGSGTISVRDTADNVEDAAFAAENLEDVSVIHLTEGDLALSIDQLDALPRIVEAGGSVVISDIATNIAAAFDGASRLETLLAFDDAATTNSFSPSYIAEGFELFPQLNGTDRSGVLHSNYLNFREGFNEGEDYLVLDYQSFYDPTIVLTRTDGTSFSVESLDVGSKQPGDTVNVTAIGLDSIGNIVAQESINGLEELETFELSSDFQNISRLEVTADFAPTGEAAWFSIDNVSLSSTGDFSLDGNARLADTLVVTSGTLEVSLAELQAMPPLELQGDAVLHVVDSADNLQDVAFDNDNLLLVDQIRLTEGDLQVSFDQLLALPPVDVQDDAGLILFDVGSVIDSIDYSGEKAGSVTGLFISGGDLTGSVTELNALPDILGLDESAVIVVADLGESIESADFDDDTQNLSQASQVVLTGGVLTDSLEGLRSFLPIDAGEGIVLAADIADNILAANFDGDDNVGQVGVVSIIGGTTLSADIDTLNALPVLSVVDGAVQIRDLSQNVQNAVFAGQNIELASSIVLTEGPLFGSVEQLQTLAPISLEQGAFIALHDTGENIQGADFADPNLSLVSSIDILGGTFIGTAADVLALPTIQFLVNDAKLQVTDTAANIDNASFGLPNLNLVTQVQVASGVLNNTIAEIRALPELIPGDGAIIVTDELELIEALPEELTGNLALVSEFIGGIGNWVGSLEDLANLPANTVFDGGVINVYDTATNILNETFDGPRTSLVDTLTVTEGDLIDTVARIAELPTLSVSGTGSVGVADTADAILDPPESPNLTVVSAIELTSGELRGTAEFINDFPQLTASGDAAVVLADDGKGLTGLELKDGNLPAVTAVEVTSGELIGSIATIQSYPNLTANGGDISVVDDLQVYVKADLTDSNLLQASSTTVVNNSPFGASFSALTIDRSNFQLDNNSELSAIADEGGFARTVVVEEGVSGTQINNLGQILSPKIGVYSYDPSTVLTNEFGATISSDGDDAVVFRHGGELINKGTISGTGFYHADGFVGSDPGGENTSPLSFSSYVINAGSMEGERFGVGLFAGGKIENEGTISATSGVLIGGQHGDGDAKGEIRNTGIISGKGEFTEQQMQNYVPVLGGTGVQFQEGLYDAFLENEGVISGDNIGVYNVIDEASIENNKGFIDGGESGIVNTGANTVITNTGQITGDRNDAIHSTASTIIVNFQTGAISGKSETGQGTDGVSLSIEDAGADLSLDLPFVVLNDGAINGIRAGVASSSGVDIGNGGSIKGGAFGVLSDFTTQ